MNEEEKKLNETVDFIHKSLTKKLNDIDENGKMLRNRAKLLLSFLIPAMAFFLDRGMTLLVIEYAIITAFVVFKVWMPVSIGEKRPTDSYKSVEKMLDSSVLYLQVKDITNTQVNIDKLSKINNERFKRLEWFVYATIISSPILYYCNLYYCKIYHYLDYFLHQLSLAEVFDFGCSL